MYASLYWELRNEGLVLRHFNAVVLSATSLTQPRWDETITCSSEFLVCPEQKPGPENKRTSLKHLFFSQGHTHQTEASAVGKTFYGVLVMWTPSATSGFIQMFPM